MAEKEIPAGADLTKLPTIGTYKQNTELAEAFQKAMEESPHVLVIREKPMWIPCSERLPDSDDPVLITCNSLCVHKAWYDDIMHRFNISDSDYWYREDAVLAWMPMPDAYEPPEKEDET